MFEHFNGTARAVFEQGAGEAGRLGHDRIGTQHLLLGMLLEGRGFAARFLAGNGIRLEPARAEVVRLAGPPVPTPEDARRGCRWPRTRPGNPA
jgi:ATP-dependent Clp protease ATP-binding subunit ClpA